MEDSLSLEDGSLPVFNMQLECLRSWVHKEIDKAMRNCVWRKDGGRRGVHLFDWETLGLPKSRGANLKIAKEMN